MLPMAGRLSLMSVIPTLMRTLGISRGHMLENRMKGLYKLRKKHVDIAIF